MTTSTIELPSGFVNDVLSQATALLGEFSPYIGLVVGVSLGLFAIDYLINAFRHK